VYCLLKVSLGDTVVYTNPDFENPSESVAPSNPDITVERTDVSPLTEVTPVNNFVPLVVAASGNLSGGTYTIELKYVYEVQVVVSPPTFAYTSSTATYTSSFAFDSVTPSLFQEWSTGVDPFLLMGDNADYDTEASAPTFETEIIYYPPQNKATVTNTYTDVASVELSSFWTGGNEMQVTTLFEYDLSDKVINYLVQAYDAFEVAKIDNCEVFKCLDELYEAYTANECNPTAKISVVTERNLIKGTSLAQLLLTGQNCNGQDLSEVVTEFNKLTDCDCNCLDTTVQQINAPGVTAASDVVTINATTANTEIDLSQGTTFIITLAANGGTTEIDAINVTQFAEYRFIFKRGFSSQEATFGSVFNSPDGEVDSVTPLLDDEVVVDFFAEDASNLLLVSRSDFSLDGITPDSDVVTIVSTTANTEIDLSQGTTFIITLAAVGETTEIDVTNVTEFEEYKFIFKRGFGNQEATFNLVFNSPEGLVDAVKPLNSDRVVLDFFAENTSSLLLVSRSDFDSDPVESIVGTSQEIDVDDSDPANPVISLADEATTSLSLADSSLQSIVGTSQEIDVDDYDPNNPIVSLADEVNTSLGLADSALQSGDNVSELVNDANYEAGVVQFVPASTATTVIDLSQGNIINITVSSNTEFQVSNAEDDKRYIFVMRSSSQSYTCTFNSSDFYGSAGGVASATVSGIPGTRTILSFIATSGITLALVSRND
jgi:hypothetical protein